MIADGDEPHRYELASLAIVVPAPGCGERIFFVFTLIELVVPLEHRPAIRAEVPPREAISRDEDLWLVERPDTGQLRDERGQFDFRKVPPSWPPTRALDEEGLPVHFAQSSYAERRYQLCPSETDFPHGLYLQVNFGVDVPHRLQSMPSDAVGKVIFETNE